MARSGPLAKNLHGQYDPEFAMLHDEFAEVVALHPAQGASLAVTVEGRAVTDLWGGMASPAAAWEATTRCVVWSTTKGMAALCVQALVDRGKIDVSAPVSRYWPEFATAGKESLTIENVLTHTAGLPYWEGSERVVCLDRPRTMLNLARITQGLAAARPVSQPGGDIVYHSITYGWLLDEIVHRATGVRLGIQFANLVGGPMGLNIRIGPDVPVGARPAPLTLINQHPDERAAILESARRAPHGVKAMLLCSEEAILEVDRISNDDDYIQAGVPSAGGLADARSLARAYGMLACGGRLDGHQFVSQGSVSLFSSAHKRSLDPVMGEIEWGLGYARNLAKIEYGPSASAYGHGGMGGSKAFADPEARIGFGYVMNSLDIGVNADRRGIGLAKVLYECL
jgi:CubicO group peptidase (beta-lactamase class C family)